MVEGTFTNYLHQGVRENLRFFDDLQVLIALLASYPVIVGYEFINKNLFFRLRQFCFVLKKNIKKPLGQEGYGVQLT